MDAETVEAFLNDADESLGPTKLKTSQGRTYTIAEVEKRTTTELIFLDAFKVLTSVKYSDIEALWQKGSE